MNSFYVEIPNYFTSYEFYNNILLQLNNKSIIDSDNVIFDFSKTYRIEPLIIPNYLCLGYEIKTKYNKIAQIYIPETVNSGFIKNYLKEIEFIKYAKKFNLFDFISDPYLGMSGKKVDPLCGTIYSDVNSSIDEINRSIKYYIEPFNNKYLNTFNETINTSNDVYYINIISELIEELISNCKIHANSFSFSTLQAKYSTKKIYISISDYGCGFSNTMHIDNKEEVYSILAGIYKRKNSKVYGLYNVIIRILKYGGKVRIHSNDTQLIFTPRILHDFIEEKLLINDSFCNYNIKRNITFDGVHVEIELPFERRDIGNVYY